jgi:hypothetical protein
MRAEITQSQLVTINLKYGSQAKHLKVIAFADLVINALYQLQEPATLEKISNQISVILDVPKLDRKLVKEAIDCLVRKKNISPYKDTWQLTKKINTEIQDERKKTPKKNM